MQSQLTCHCADYCVRFGSRHELPRFLDLVTFDVESAMHAAPGVDFGVLR
jgi:hypothetical protein